MEKYTVDFTNKTLTISAKFSEKLQDIDSEEFALYERFAATIPGLTVIRRTHKTPSKYKTESGEKFACNQFKNLKYKNMENFISALPDNEEYFREYTFIKYYASKVQTNGYALVRRWFVAQFPEFRKNPLFYLYNRPALIPCDDFISQQEENAA